MRLQYFIFNTSFMLLSINFAIGQSLQTVDVYFEEDTASPIFESELRLDSLFTFGDIDFASYEILIETFPNSTKEIRSLRAAFLADILNYNASKATKIVHYEDIEHLYFIDEDIEDWNFLRLIFTPISLDEIEENQTSNDVGINEALPKSTSRGITRKYQKDVIDAKNTYELKLKGGTKVNILPNSFQNAKGELITGGVVIKTREILSKTQAILADVTTNIGDGYLESKGMIEVLAETVQGEVLQLVPGMSLSIEIPQEKSIEGQGYGIYEGVELDNGTLDWRLTGNPIQEINKPKWRCFSWVKISEVELDSMAQVRKDFTAKIKSIYGKKGKTPNAYKLNWHQNKFDRYKNKVKKSNKRRKRVSTVSTKSNRDLSTIKKWMVYGKAKYRLESDTLITSFFTSSSFRISTLGFCNIDRIIDKSNWSLVPIMLLHHFLTQALYGVRF